MAETSEHGKRRPRRSTQVSQQLARARQRNAAQLVEQRAQEQRVEEGLDAFMRAEAEVTAVEEDCEEKVTRLQRKIDALRGEAERKSAGARTRQARAALAIHRAGRTVPQVADLLSLSEKAARRLIAAGSEAEAEGDDDKPRADGAGESAAPKGADTSESASPGEDGQAGQPSGEQRYLGGIDGHEDGSDTGFVPASVTDGGGQSP